MKLLAGYCPVKVDDYRIYALVNALQRLLRCPALSLDDLDQEDIDACQEAEEVLAKAHQ